VRVRAPTWTRASTRRLARTPIGSKVNGGGGDASAHPFDVTFKVYTAIFQYISARFEAQAIGYTEIDSYKYKDNRDKGARALLGKQA
jgi:hypothetical protein